MNNKLLISLNSLSTIAVVTPILSTVSCTGDTPINSNDLIITSKIVPKLTQEDIIALNGIDLPAQFKALSKLFGGPGLTSENQTKFKVFPDENNKIVTLIANSNFTINGRATLDSSKYDVLLPDETIHLTIAATKDVKLNDAEVAALGGANIEERWAVLEILFEGKDFAIENQDKFSVVFDKSANKVTLIANVGVTINGSQVLSNTFTINNIPVVPTDLTIKAKGSIQLNGDQIINLTSTIPATQLTALKLLFEGEGLTEENLTHFNVTVNSSTNIVTLTAKLHFTINGKSKLDSAAYTVKVILLDSYPLQSIQLTAQQIDDLNDPIKAQPILSRMFSDLNFSRITWTVNKTRRIVTLIAKQGFIFKNGGGPMVSSNPWINV
ncbi:MAG: hypothetical protein ACRC9U_01885 [Metamycoplasmataceae bacterium]